MFQRVMNKVVTLFTAAFGVVAALAWDDVVKSLFREYYPFPGAEMIQAKFLYALAVTTIAVIITTIFASMSSKKVNE
jgi:hypothetical protein